MRLFAYLAVYGSLSAAQKDRKIQTLGQKTIDLRGGKTNKGKNKAEKVAAPQRVQAPRPPLMSEEELIAKMSFNGPPVKTNFNEDFAAFALKNQFPPAVTENRMLEEYARRVQVRKKDEEKNEYLQQLRRQNNTKRLSCLTCSSQSYEECYRTGQVRECGQDEGACFLETRFLGHTVMHVTSGCQQKVACINNMKQNFWDIDGNGIHLLDEQMHDCKLFSGGQGASSVCRNCCFDDKCTKDWQPNSFDEWRIMPKTPQMREMMVFDQFANPPEHWMKAAEQRRIEYFTNLEDMKKPPTTKKDKKKGGKDGEKNAKEDSDGVINLRTTPRPIRTTRPTTRPTTRRPTTRRPTTRPTTRRPMVKATKPKTTQTPGRFANMHGAQKQPNMQRMMQMRQARMRAAAAAGKKPTTTQKPTTQKPTTRKVVKTTPKPKATTTISDDAFMNLLNILGKKEQKKQQKPSNNQMRFSLNVNEEGEVNQMYGKDAEKKNTNVADRLGKPVNAQPPKGSQVINRNQFAQKAEVQKSKFGPASTTKSPTTVKKGPWAHLPPWKQRQLKAARQRQLAAKSAANGGAKPAGQKPTIKPAQKPVARQPIRKPAAQPIKKGQPIRRPGQPMKKPVQQMKKPPQKQPLRRTPVRAPAPTGKKSKKPSAAKPQMMKFSQWAEPTDAKLEEGDIVEIQSDVSDEQFAAMIAGMDSKSDFDSLIDNIEEEIAEVSFGGPDPRYRMTDEEFDDFVSQLS
jgi:hypothetical protein